MKITEIKQQVKRPDRYSIYIDGAFAFGLSESGLLQSGLARGQEIDQQRLEVLQDTAVADKAYGNALRYVAMRQRSEWELRTYLHRKKIDEPIIQQIMQRLVAVDLLNDLSFAQMWVANRRILKPTSLRKLRLELKQKHLAENIIDQVLREDDTNERDVLHELVDKKRARYPDQMKFMQYLARQGFSYDDIKSALQSDIDN